MLSITLIQFKITDALIPNKLSMILIKILIRIIDELQAVHNLFIVGYVHSDKALGNAKQFVSRFFFTNKTIENLVF
jgi:hypothetical protein